MGPANRKLLGGALGGALIGLFIAGFLSVVIANIIQFIPRGLMTRFPWPLNHWLVVMLAGGVIGMVMGALGRARAISRAQRLESIAAANGLEYRAGAAIAELAAPAFKVFEGTTVVENLIRGKVGGVSIAVFDCQEIIKASPERYSRAPATVYNRTVVLVPGEGLPTFYVGPRDLSARLLEAGGIRPISFDTAAATVDDAQAVKQFGRMFHLGTWAPLDLASSGEEGIERSWDETAEQSLRRLFTPRVQAALLRYPGWTVESKDGQLAIWQGGHIQPADAWPDLWQGALDLRRVIVSGGRGEPGSTSVLPSDPSRVPSQILRRTAGFVGLGGVVGLMGGFVAGWLVGFTAFVESPPQTGPAPLHARPSVLRRVAFVGSTILGGGVLGAVLGSTLAAAGERVTRRGT